MAEAKPRKSFAAAVDRQAVRARDAGYRVDVIWHSDGQATVTVRADVDPVQRWLDDGGA